jgi:prepilin-type N-terminal cleavage/methylation domain-containing protein
VKANKTKKGFTLMELIIVLAIMGILLAIIVPSWGYFIRRARERSANAKAKVVFNAAQTEVTRMGAKERPLNNVVHDSTSDTDYVTNKIQPQIYMGDYQLKDRTKEDTSSNREYFDFYFYWDGNEGRHYKSDGSLADATENDARFARSLNSIIGTEGTYKIYVKNYNVVSVVYSDYADGNYKGTYPLGMDELTDSVREDVRTKSVESVDMTKLALPTT